MTLLEVAGLRVGDLDYQRLGNHRGRGLEVIRQPSWTYNTGYVFNAYGRPSLTLRTLEGLLGRRTMARVMRTYAERWRFGHPSSDDFYRVASEVAGRDLMPFFRQTRSNRRRWSTIPSARSRRTRPTPPSRCGVRATCRCRSWWRSS